MGLSLVQEAGINQKYTEEFIITHYTYVKRKNVDAVRMVRSVKRREGFRAEIMFERISKDRWSEGGGMG